jgi:3-oxoacyl-[acyl-carrier-protein] synthase II
MSDRVVVTGMAGLSPVGSTWETVRASLEGQRSGVAVIPEWADYEGLDTRLGAPVRDFAVPAHYPRKKVRSMGRVALLATRATELALEDAGLLGSAALTDGRTGIAYGSTTGSPPAMEVYAGAFYTRRSLKGIAGTDYLQFMSHTCAANLAQFFGITGRIVPTCSACTAGSQGIGYAYEAIASGKQAIMVAGGAEELHAVNAAVFDIMFATSTRNDAPDRTPRPFDLHRDGLVVGEGAGTLVLERLQHAVERGARIHAEVVGFGTNGDGRHITNPDVGGMQRVMELALEDARLVAGDIGYVNAHGTATEAGDIAESVATHRVFGAATPVSSLKSYLGHTLGACGALEAWITIKMMQERRFAPNLNLDAVDPRCGPLDYIRTSTRALEPRHVMSNNFAFGGVNTSLIFRRWDDDEAPRAS